VKNRVELMNFVLEYDGTMCPLFILLKLYNIHRIHREGDNIWDRKDYLVISNGHGYTDI
jgi:transketolase N-terminal domain/subunit